MILQLGWPPTNRQNFDLCILFTLKFEGHGNYGRVERMGFKYGGNPWKMEGRWKVRGRPHVRKQSFFPPSSSASFQEYLRPHGSTENDRKHCSSYSRPIDGAWDSPKTEKRRSMHIKLTRCKQTDRLNTTRRRWKWLLQGNQNCLCGPLMRSNCCCDLHSTTVRVSCKKGSISSAARTGACSPPLLLLLLLWDVAVFRGQRQEVEGWDDGVIVSERMQIRRPHKNGRAAFSDFSTQRPFF